MNPTQNLTIELAGPAGSGKIREALKLITGERYAILQCAHFIKNAEVDRPLLIDAIKEATRTCGGPGGYLVFEGLDSLPSVKKNFKTLAAANVWPGTNIIYTCLNCS